ncbi:MAG TPA: hypothetical protein VM389_13500 [Phycisphaerae bacterium]|nr:hypothetical protein [Phycisphaerae bacterium]HUU58921.1 hypothetical protein [Phycisphaerae bacterium]
MRQDEDISIEDRDRRLLAQMDALADALDRRRYPGSAWPTRRARRRIVRVLWGSAGAAAAAGVLIALSWSAICLVEESGTAPPTSAVSRPAPRPAEEEPDPTWADVNPSLVARMAREATKDTNLAGLDFALAGSFRLEIPAISILPAAGSEDQRDEDVPAQQLSPSSEEERNNHGSY